MTLSRYGQPLTGTAAKDPNFPTQRWILNRDDGFAFMMTRTTNNIQSAAGTDLTITIDEGLQGAQDSITIKDFPFDKGTGLSISLEGLLPSNAVAPDGYEHVAFSKIDNNRVAQLLMTYNTPSVGYNELLLRTYTLGSSKGFAVLNNVADVARFSYPMPQLRNGGAMVATA